MGDFNNRGTHWEDATGQFQYHVKGETFFTQQMSDYVKSQVSLPFNQWG